ncbi:STAS domain-containing protein [Saccharothrix syringae]|uniref:STAS domain-containing protein n=1 Tax=Saccharothrix syringae TaxID=103733 RepID=UPI00068FC236|nr:STAS domain-containing protein [Saccharothrix syringae]
MATGGEYVEQLRVEREHRDDVVVVLVSGELDSTTEPRLREELTAAFAGAAVSGVPVVVDLTGVGFFASVGMALLVEHHRLGVRRGTPLRVVAPARSPLRALRAAQLDQVLDLYPDLPSALA